MRVEDKKKIYQRLQAVSVPRWSLWSIPLLTHSEATTGAKFLSARRDCYVPLWLEKRGFSQWRSRVQCNCFGLHLS